MEQPIADPRRFKVLAQPPARVWSKSHSSPERPEHFNHAVHLPGSQGGLLGEIIFDGFRVSMPPLYTSIFA